MPYSEVDIEKIEALLSMIRSHDTSSRRAAKKNEARLGWTLVGVVMIVELPDIFILFWGALLISVLYMSLRGDLQAQKIKRGYEKELANYGIKYTTGKFVLVESLDEVVRMDVLAERLRLANKRSANMI
tara:strand:- start:698 stop:1084 length:387 start_codon:yes stop_codon:yes gene_type:complete